MPDAISTLLTQIEHLLAQGEPGATLDTCYFGVRLGDGAGRLVLRILPTNDSARHRFAIDGNQFTPPQNWTSGGFRRQGDGTITDRTSFPRPEPNLPVEVGCGHRAGSCQGENPRVLAITRCDQDARRQVSRQRA